MHERSEELVPATRGRRLELVEEREIGPRPARATHVDLAAGACRSRPTEALRSSGDGSNVHGATR